ncbi:type I-E CRISPR-associated protein Cas6/Cse3/CasE [Pseudoflavonifractor sp.]|jgi:CRISPR system Cascade subunit CasE|uniref:type I-E CRISPR-associated protein Cas6/Cse3/CasE n=1 Tax=Pseudoflavonifractor sp. TaxID=1980281 RepID=UPI003D8A21ED
MYLTKIDLLSRQWSIQRALGDCQQLHQMIMGLFETDRKSAGVLYRVREGSCALAVYLYSNRPVNRERILPGMRFSGERELTPWLDAMGEGQIWNFDLLASPTKKVVRGEGKNSQRRVLRTLEERCAWLERKGDQNGFRLLNCREIEGSQLTGRHTQKRGGRMYLDQYHYQGALQITDAEQFRKAVQGGIGPGKSYGLGMLLLSR